MSANAESVVGVTYRSFLSAVQRSEEKPPKILNMIYDLHRENCNRCGKYKYKIVIKGITIWKGKGCEGCRWEV